LRRGHAALNCFYLGQRAVLVVLALDHERGARNRREIFLDVPAAKLRIELDVIPSAKCLIDMIVIARQFFREIA
jgi:hypothetical protein